MKIPKEGTLRHRIFVLLKGNPTVAYRPPEIAAKFEADVTIVSATMAQMSSDEGGDGLLTRCKVFVPGQRDSWEYRIAAAASGAAPPLDRSTAHSAASNFKPPRTFRRDQDQAPIPSNHGRSASKDDRNAKPKRTPESKPAKKPRAPYGSKKKAVAGKRSKAAGRRSKQAAPAAELQRLPAPPAAPGFRCAVYSDGSLSLKAARGEFELNPVETHRLFDYLEKFVREAGAS